MDDHRAIRASYPTLGGNLGGQVENVCPLGAEKGQSLPSSALRRGARFDSVTKFSPTKLSLTEFLSLTNKTNKGINSYLFTEGDLDFSPTNRNLLLLLEISHQPVAVGEKCHTI